MNRQLIEDAITRLVIAVSTAALLWLPALAPIREPLVDALAQAIPDTWTPPVTAAGALTIWGIACIVLATFSAAEHVADAYRDRRRQDASTVAGRMGDPA
ncbi:hypothetical protein Rhow_004596 [Rhodococcus wratislaviensis]|uniref:Uncharacterized protein n=1 Tax=Rhodococcus wratislaviensis TaxID=44752 RepID=A0A402CBL5_RHOWR|nr:hypothetical protein [Rhodococcus wratislaviensis]GCE40953.1 hypothetical protein Rhow_004596 [Rhodococcus wratislaviensis]